MKEKSVEQDRKVQSERRDQTLRLAMAAATLGMTMGISPGDTLAAPAYAIAETENTIPSERVGAEFPKVERPSAVFPKVERPAAAFPKMEKPGAEFPKVEMPGAAFPKVEKP